MSRQFLHYNYIECGISKSWLLELGRLVLYTQSQVFKRDSIISKV